MTDHAPFQPVSAVLACLLPGAGHMARGEVKRGLAVATGVLGLFFGGIFIGGIDVIDSKEDRVWFLGQALVGPLAFGVDYVHQNSFKVREVLPDVRGRATVVRLRSAAPNEGRKPDGSVQLGGTPPNRKSVGKVNELGTLFATIAGMMNVIAILDAAVPSKRSSAQPADDSARRGGQPGPKA